MEVSQNGYPTIIDRDDPRLVSVPYIKGKVLKGDVEVIFTDLIRYFHDNVENIELGYDDWGWNYRPIEGTTTPSNHASATAIDLNSLRHPMYQYNTFSIEQRYIIRNHLLPRYDGVIRWGGDYKNRPDDMHFEINASPAEVALVARRLRLLQPVKPKEFPDIALILDGDFGVFTKKAWQYILREVTGDYKGIIDGDFGEMSYKAVQTFLKRSGFYTGIIDGDFGSMSVKALQSFLQAHSFYVYRIDGDFGPRTVRSLQKYLNTERSFITTT